METQLFVQIALNGWNQQVARAEKFFNGLSDEAFQRTVGAGKNRIIYLYGHLTAYHDMLKETLGLGTATHSFLVNDFLKNADDVKANMPSVAELRQYWAEVHNELNVLFAALPAEDWFKRHNAMTDEDFKKDPTRNRLSVLLSRTNHIAYHFGQLVLA
ncbi:DinB family protein [Mucilaginibacter terrenus]|uniref:DinB family protein n=1 Tax=Mucilaginibacter terrenus TaxID=2482727 RepID=A0A3E2NTD1_9SPHI|nr:DinB family protein [Mucilaginibacter terrenus]RFZ84266.1 DinB family protein [Mucilaginibacter terrenus]